MKTTILRLSIILLIYDCTEGFIIPNDVPTVLNVIYANLPPIKKGTDSRVGVGFRLGEHADFQILLELGPQKETEPIGPSTDQKLRRMATFAAAMRGDMGPWAQTVAKYQMQLKMQKELDRIKMLENKLARTKPDNGAKNNRKKVASNDWLTRWSTGEISSNENDSSTKMVSVERITLNVKNDRRVVQNGGTFDAKKKNLQKLLIPQLTR